MVVERLLAFILLILEDLNELFEITIYIRSYDFFFFGLLLAYSGLFFGPKLETSQLLLHTIAMMAMRIGMAFTFFLAMTVKTVGNWPIFGPKLETIVFTYHSHEDHEDRNGFHLFHSHDH